MTKLCRMFSRADSLMGNGMTKKRFWVESDRQPALNHLSAATQQPRATSSPLSASALGVGGHGPGLQPPPDFVEQLRRHRTVRLLLPEGREGTGGVPNTPALTFPPPNPPYKEKVRGTSWAHKPTLSRRPKKAPSIPLSVPKKKPGIPPPSRNEEPDPMFNITIKVTLASYMWVLRPFS